MSMKFEKLGVLLLSRESCIKLGLLEEGWPLAAIKSSINELMRAAVTVKLQSGDVPRSKYSIIAEWPTVFLG